MDYMWLVKYSFVNSCLSKVPSKQKKHDFQRIITNMEWNCSSTHLKDEYPVKTRYRLNIPKLLIYIIIVK